MSIKVTITKGTNYKYCHPFFFFDNNKNPNKIEKIDNEKAEMVMNVKINAGEMIRRVRKKKVERIVKLVFFITSINIKIEQIAKNKGVKNNNCSGKKELIILSGQ